MTKSKLTIYSAPGCSPCHRLKDFLRSKNVEFTEVDLSKSRESVKDLSERMGGDVAVPIVEKDGKIIQVGFNPSNTEDLEAAL